MTDSSSDYGPDYEPDPVFVSSLREAKWILVMWLACYAWTMAVCGWLGYPESVNPETFPTVLGIPFWVAVGIALPWLAANVVTVWFCLGYMQDNDLDDAPQSDRLQPGDGHPQDAGREASV